MKIDSVERVKARLRGEEWYVDENFPNVLWIWDGRAVWVIDDAEAMYPNRRKSLFKNVASFTNRIL